MGGRKFHLGRHRKNGERKKTQKDQPPDELKVSFPLVAYLDTTISSVTALSSRLGQVHMPPLWVIAQNDPLILCKLHTQQSKAPIGFSLSILPDFSWNLSVGAYQIGDFSCHNVPEKVNSASSLLKVLSCLDEMRLCPGNQDKSLVELWRHRSLTLNGLSSE